MIKEKKLERIGNYREDGKRWQQFSLKTMDFSSARLAEKVHIERDDSVLRLHFPNPTWPPGISEGDQLVRFGDASFRYESSEQQLLKGLTLTINRGSKIPGGKQRMRQVHPHEMDIGRTWKPGQGQWRGLATPQPAHRPRDPVLGRRAGRIRAHVRGPVRRGTALGGESFENDHRRGLRQRATISWCLRIGWRSCAPPDREVVGRRAHEALLCYRSGGPTPHAPSGRIHESRGPRNAGFDGLGSEYLPGSGGYGLAQPRVPERILPGALGLGKWTSAGETQRCRKLRREFLQL